MAHERFRYLEPLVRKALKFSPAVGLLGQRQTGKTTLASKIAHEYVSLDRRESLTAAESEPEAFLSGRKSPFAIDECQLAPPLFPAIKESIRERPGVGRFILTGSVRFTSRRAIRESLTGRIFNLELLPLSIAESHGVPLSELPLKLLNSSDRAIFAYVEARKKITAFASKSEIDRFLSTGGLPGICFHREPDIRSGKFASHIETLLERDLRLLIETKLSYSRLKTLLTVLARRQGMPIDLTEVARASRISRPTLRGLMSAFESMFLLRIMPALGGTARPILMFEDQGLAFHLNSMGFDPHINVLRVLFASVFPQFHYRSELNSTYAHFLSRGGASVPLVVRTRDGVVGYIPEIDMGPSRASIAAARSLIKDTPQAKIVIAHKGDEARALGGGIYSIPLRACL